MTASEKLAYLKGLAEGMGLKDDTNEGKLTKAIIDVLETLTADVEDLEANTEDMADTIDQLGEDIAYVEDLCLGDEDDDEDIDDYDYDDDYPECSSCAGDCETECNGCCGAASDDEGDEVEYEVTCPKCGKVITVYDSDLDFGSIRCPDCDAELEFDLDSDDGEEAKDEE